MMKLIKVSIFLLAAVAMAGCKKEEALTQTGDINLAGCEVPAGISWEEAEKVKCQPDPTVQPQTQS